MYSSFALLFVISLVVWAPPSTRMVLGGILLVSVSCFCLLTLGSHRGNIQVMIAPDVLGHVFGL